MILQKKILFWMLMVSKWSSWPPIHLVLSIKFYVYNIFLKMKILDSLDLEMGIYEEDLRAKNWMAKFKNTGLIKWVIIQGTLIPKKCVHFPLIFIFCLLFSDVYPDILTITTSLIISLIIFFIITIVIQSKYM